MNRATSIVTGVSLGLAAATVSILLLRSGHIRGAVILAALLPVLAIFTVRKAGRASVRCCGGMRTGLSKEE